jgi:hypothetical protein
MIHVIWAFVVKAEAIARFERAYGPDGAWARLFRAYQGFRGTTLLRDRGNPRRYLTIDLWDTSAQRRYMLTAGKARYADLDETLADLTESEDEIGTFEAPTIPKPRRRTAVRGHNAAVTGRGSRATTRSPRRS